MVARSQWATASSPWTQAAGRGTGVHLLSTASSAALPGTTTVWINAPRVLHRPGQPIELRREQGLGRASPPQAKRTLEAGSVEGLGPPARSHHHCDQRQGRECGIRGECDLLGVETDTVVCVRIRTDADISYGSGVVRAKRYAPLQG